MTTTEREYIKANLKWSFSWWDIFERYFVVAGPIAITVGAYSMFYGGFKFGHIYENNFMNPFFFTATGGLLFGLFFIYYTIRRIEIERRFVPLELPKNISFDEIPIKVKSSNWTVETKTNELIEISTNFSLFSRGELMTVIKNDENSILVNSRPIGRQPFTFNRDRVNFNKLKSVLI